MEYMAYRKMTNPALVTVGGCANTNLILRQVLMKEKAQTIILERTFILLQQ